jgi:hypothetical protein
MRTRQKSGQAGFDIDLPRDETSEQPGTSPTRPDRLFDENDVLIDEAPDDLDELPDDGDASPGDRRRDPLRRKI